MYFDMSESKRVLLRFKNNYDESNDNVNKALERIEALYNKEIDAYVQETYEMFLAEAKENGIKHAVNVVSEAISSKFVILGNIVSILAGEVVSKGYEEMKVIAMYEWIEGTDKAFENALERLKIADENDANYNILVKSVQEAFDAAKEARLDFFTNMKKLDSNEKEYYDYCIKVMKTASLNDDMPLELLFQTGYNGRNFNPLTELR